MKTYLFVSEKTWHDSLFNSLKDNIPAKWIRARHKEDFTEVKVNELHPDIIFIPHWSFMIPAGIYDNYETIVFHMTDLPFGRGGSPLQNLIVKGYENTVITAIKVDKGIDTGDIYLKMPLSLNGTAEEIFLRSTVVIGEMIEKIIRDAPIPQKQEGEAVTFKRRNKNDGNIEALNSIEEVYDYIRMLDCEGYPNAFLEIGKFRLEFSRASLKGNKSIIADVRITEK